MPLAVSKSSGSNKKKGNSQGKARRQTGGQNRRRQSQGYDPQAGAPQYQNRAQNYGLDSGVYGAPPPNYNSSRYPQVTGNDFDSLERKERPTPGGDVVAPGGLNIMGAIFGANAARSPFFDFSGAGLFGQDPFAYQRFMWDSQMRGGGNPGGQSGANFSRGGIMGQTPELMDATNFARTQAGQYHPALGNLDQWFNVGGQGQGFWDQAGGGAGPMQHLVGRQGQTLGWGGMGPGQSPMLDAMSFLTSAEHGQNPWRDPAYALEQAGRISEGTNAAGDMDPYIGNVEGLDARGEHIGGRGTSDIAAQQNEYEQGLLRDIDTEAERTLGLQLPEVQAALEKAGIGRSGSAGFAGGELASDILGQANRDKQRTMAQIRESGMDRFAQSRNLQSQLGAGSEDLLNQILGSSYGQQAGVAGQQGLSNLGSMHGLLGQFGGQANMLGQGELDRYLQAMQMGEGFRQSGIGMEHQLQSGAMRDMMDMFNFRQGNQNQSIDRMLALSEQQRMIDQQMLSGMMGMGMQPMDMMMALATGIAPGYNPASGGGGGGNPWMGMLGNLGGAAIGAYGNSRLNSPYQGGYDRTGVNMGGGG